MPRRVDLSGKRFGLLTVDEFAGTIKRTPYWFATCDCGIYALIRTQSLTDGITKSCGCLRKPELIGKQFGMLTITSFAGKRGNQQLWTATCSCGNTVTATTNNFNSGDWMSCGCTRKQLKVDARTRNPAYYLYKRLIHSHSEVKDYWNDFDDFIRDVGERPTPRHRLSRKNENLNHGPLNTYWRLQIEERQQRRDLELNDELAIDMSSIFG